MNTVNAPDIQATSRHGAMAEALCFGDRYSIKGFSLHKIVKVYDHLFINLGNFL